MKKIILGFLLLLSSTPALSRKLNFIESHLFRLSGYDRTEEWILPFYRYHKNSFPNFKFNIFASSHLEVPDVISDIDSKDQNKIQNRINESFGQPYDASAKILIGVRYSKFFQTFAANAGSVIIANDPVFPSLDAILFQDYTATTSYFIKVNKSFYIIPKLIYGRRRTLDTSLSVAQLIAQKPDTKIKNQPWNTFVELSLKSELKLDYLNLIFELNSLPLTNNNYEYWNTNLGVRSKNFAASLSNFRKMDMFLTFSPFYAGEYNYTRAFNIGLGIEFNKLFMADIFLQDEFLLGAILKLNLKHFTCSLFTFNRSYDDFHTQKSRNFGINLIGQF